MTFFVGFHDLTILNGWHCIYDHLWYGKFINNILEDVSA